MTIWKGRRIYIRVYTYTGARDDEVIDYALGNEETRIEFDRPEMNDRVESDHHPVVVTMRRGNARR